MALCKCEQAGQPTDLILFTTYLRTTNQLDHAGGASFITSLYTFVPTAANVMYYAPIVIERYNQRTLMAACTLAAHKAAQPEANVEQIKLSLWGDLKETESRNNESKTVEVVREIQDMVAARQIGGEIALRTGIPPWDKALKGVFRKRFYVLGSRPKIGKSALMEIAAQTLIDEGKAVLIFQRDMSLTDMIGRMSCRKAGVIYEDFTTGVCSNDDLEAVSRAADRINPDLLRTYEPTNMTAEELVSIVEREIIQNDIQVFFLDLFQRLQVGKKDKVEGLTDAANLIRAVIQTTGVPGIVAAEILKDADKTHRPHSGQFKYCDGLFSTCDVSILLWSDDDPKQLMNEDGEMRRQKVMFTIDANRGGGVGEEVMYFDRPHMTFHEEESEEDEA